MILEFIQREAEGKEKGQPVRAWCASELPRRLNPLRLR
jgi:hypothetical protein